MGVFGSYYSSSMRGLVLLTVLALAAVTSANKLIDCHNHHEGLKWIVTCELILEDKSEECVDVDPETCQKLAEKGECRWTNVYKICQKSCNPDCFRHTDREEVAAPEDTCSCSIDWMDLLELKITYSCECLGVKLASCSTDIKEILDHKYEVTCEFGIGEE